MTRVNLLIRFLKKYILFWNNWIKVWLGWRSIFGQNYVFSGQKLFWMKVNLDTEFSTWGGWVNFISYHFGKTSIFDQNLWLSNKKLQITQIWLYHDFEISCLSCSFLSKIIEIISRFLSWLTLCPLADRCCFGTKLNTPKRGRRVSECKSLANNYFRMAPILNPESKKVKISHLKSFP